MDNQKLYTTGEIAKMAKVTIRTIRYYDKKGLLKPSTLTSSGHRLYTKKDFEKLKRILALKYLGLSLEEVMDNLDNDFSKDSVAKSLHVQKIIIQNKIHHMKTILSAIEAAEDSIENDNSLDWSKTVDIIKILQEEKELRQKYIDASNLNAEVRLFELFGVNEKSWYEWVVDHINFKNQDKVLEIGCGDGSLWYRNYGKLPQYIDVTVTEVNEEMLKIAKQNMKQMFNHFKYEVVHPGQLPYPDESFDVIIANNILFYMKNVTEILAEIQRVLKKGGRFYCSTIDENHMKELEDLVKGYHSNVLFTKNKQLQNFGCENGAQLLSNYFTEISCEFYKDELIINDFDKILDYVYSIPGNILDIIENKRKDFETYMRRNINPENGFSTSNRSVLFKSKKHER